MTTAALLALTLSRRLAPSPSLIHALSTNRPVIPSTRARRRTTTLRTHTHTHTVMPLPPFSNPILPAATHAPRINAHAKAHTRARDFFPVGRCRRNTRTRLRERVNLKIPSDCFGRNTLSHSRAAYYVQHEYCTAARVIDSKGHYETVRASCGVNNGQRFREKMRFAFWL